MIKSVEETWETIFLYTLLGKTVLLIIPEKFTWPIF